jgi:DNA-binding NarL/FixJ family response regulator
VSDRPIRVLVVDDHTVVRQGLRAYLEASDGVEWVGEAADVPAARAELAQLRAQDRLPDVLLLDLALPGPTGMQLLQSCRAEAPSLRVVVVTGSTEIERVHDALQAGAAGYLFKTADGDEVMAAVPRVGTSTWTGGLSASWRARQPRRPEGPT